MKDTNLTRFSTVSGLFAAAVLFLLLGGVGAITDPWRWDESFSWYVVHLPWGAMWDKIAGDVHPPLYYWLLAGWVNLWPEPGSMKAFSLVAGLIATLTAGAAGMVISGKRAGIYTALLWATFPQFLHFSQDARMYSMALGFEAMALLGWAVAFRRRRLGWAIATISLAGAMYTQNLCLFFAVSLLGVEGFRICMCGLRRRPLGNTLGWCWLVTASAAIVLLYLPWIPILNNQRKFGALLEIFIAPHADSALAFLFRWSYSLDNITSAIAWLPPALVFLALPAFSLLMAGRADGIMEEPAPPRWVPVAVGTGSLAMVLVYSIYFQPILAIERHTVLFTPFLLFAAAHGLDRIAARSRLAPLMVIAVTAGFALFALSKPRDPDRSATIGAILAKAPANLPILTQPVTFPEGTLEWDPLPVLTVGNMKGIEAMTSCTLAISPVYSCMRTTLNNSARAAIERAADAVELQRSQQTAAYVLHGLPPGTLAALVGRTSKTPRTRFFDLMGDLYPDGFWSGVELAKICQPAGAANTRQVGVRLMANHTRLVMDKPAQPGIYAIGLGTQVLGRYDKDSLSIRYGNRSPILIRNRNNELAVELVGGSRPQEFVFQIPDSLVRLKAAPTGDSPDGVYVDWAARVQLCPFQFRRKGWDGSWFAVGSSHDVLYVRDGFHEREGTAAASYRWTQRDFEIEMPVWPDTHPKQLAVWGMVPSQVQRRTLQVKAILQDSTSTTPAAVAATELPIGNFGCSLLDLSAPLEPGIYRFEFSLDNDFVPSEHGAGGDPRHLGILLNAVGLR